ncbi:formylglycine-generating enzyme family protein [Tepidicaulis sp. LMO-SS28]|uniref:formylglycine-generating enzyme family protein n=1 Tax=Tepidicaulis sp. LMO-SS28 TaxID=3447455 RepID=UPI003EE12A47
MTSKRFLIAAALALVLLLGAAMLFLLALRNANGPEEFAACLPQEERGSEVLIEGGTFTMGDDVYEDEGPTRQVTVGSFYIDTHEVTNRQFARFVEETGYVTVAERGPDPALYPGIDPAMLTPGSTVFIMPADLQRGGDVTQWWQFIEGANWRAPEGPGSSIEGREDFPVIHITYDDAMAYAEWAGRDLPTEAEWEYAARGGLEKERYGWEGGKLAPDGKYRANTWQGVFPLYDGEEDGFHLAAPVGCYEPNGYGLYDMIGNVWEWTGDWYAPRQAGETDNPEGVAQAMSRDPAQPGMPVRVIKGGSFLCAPNYCMRYRPGARHAQDLGLGAAHLGFRTVRRPVNANLNGSGS